MRSLSCQRQNVMLPGKLRTLVIFLIWYCCRHTELMKIFFLMLILILLLCLAFSSFTPPTLPCTILLLFFGGGSYICMFKWADYRGRTSDSKYQEISLVFHISILFRIFNSFCLSLWNCSKCPNNDKHSCQAFKFHFFTSLHTSWNLYWFSLSFNVALLSAASAIIDKWSSLIEQEQSGRAK